MRTDSQALSHPAAAQGRLAWRCVLRLAMTIVVAATAHADTIQNTPGSGSTGSFQPFPTSFAVNGESGNPYWANPSIDGAQRNIAYFLTGVGGPFPATSPGLASPPWFGNPNGSAAASFRFMSAVAMRATVSLPLTFTANAMEIGWYDVANPAVLHQLFTTSSPLGATQTFFPGAGVSYGFYAHYLPGSPGNPIDYYYTQDELDTGTVGSERYYYGTRQHFAVFAQSLVPNAETYYIGLEDGFGPNGLERQGDFQDIVLQLRPTALDNVPEPASFTLGLLSIALALAIKWFNERTHSRNTRSTPYNRRSESAGPAATPLPFKTDAAV